MRRSLSRWISSIVLACLLASANPAQAASQPRTRTAGTPYDLINAVNVLRASYGLAPYNINPILMSTAQAQADYMAATGNVSHTGLGGSSVTERLLAAGYPLAGDLSLGGFRSENITAGNESKTAQDAVNDWTGDTLHLTTMISSSLTDIGAGVSVNAGRVYYVIDCAMPTTTGAPQPAAETAVATVSTVMPGGSVSIPVIVVTPNAEGDLIHEVKAGQTLWQIAIAYETKIDAIKRLNNLYNSDIYPGDQLLIRKGTTVFTNTPLAAVTFEIIMTATSLPTITPPVMTSTSTAAFAAAPLSVSTSRVMSIAIGIITLALLAGIFFISRGDTGPINLKSKE